MEPTNHKIVRGFLDDKSRNEIIEYVNSIKENIELEDHHLKHLISKINGSSYMYDISKTDLTDKLTKYQSGGHVMQNELPKVFHDLIDKIAVKMNIPTDQSFLQIVDMDQGGIIGKHYDASFDGFVNYKCNISVLSENYDFCIDDEVVNVDQLDMYCFEASLYKHWTLKPYTSRRILLSFGFLVPYENLGRTVNDPRVRLSNRIQKYFQH
jgi:hypothetical protein